MAKTILPTNYVDDVLNGAMDGKRRYREIPNADGTFSLEDATTYEQVGSNFGASQLNLMNDNINQSFDANKMLKTMDEVNAVMQEGYGVDALVVKHVNESLGEQPSFVYDDNGQITGYTTKIGGADTVFPFKSGISTAGNMVQFTSSSQIISADDCKVGDVYVCLGMSGQNMVSVSNLVNCEVIKNEYCSNAGAGNYARSCAVIKCLAPNVSFTVDWSNTGSYNYSYYMRLS